MAFRTARTAPAAARTADAEAGTEPDGRVEIVLYHDVLCAWSYVADQRLGFLREEYGSAVHWRFKGFPLRPDHQLPDRKQRAAYARHFRRISKQQEGSGVVTDLWTGNDPPASSLPPLIALEAALPQGEEAQLALLKALRQAAFLRGLNVARRDVLVEVAGSCGLDVSRFLERYDEPATEKKINDAVSDAESMGIRGVPALIIGDEWLMQGCRDLSEYRQVIDKFLRERVTTPALRMLH